MIHMSESMIVYETTKATCLRVLIAFCARLSGDTWLWHRSLCGLIFLVLFCQNTLIAQPLEAGSTPVFTEEEPEQVVSYMPGFFLPYQPSTALDMVRQLPGFQLDDGESLRGFGSASGNILINNRRPSAKQDSSSAILARIPASQVARIELIRGQIRGIDMLGQSSLANIVLQGDFPALIRWDTYIRLDNVGPDKPGIDVSLSDNWRGIDYNAGLIVEKEANGQTGIRKLFNAKGIITEHTDFFQDSSGIDIIPTLTASTWFGEVLLNANIKAVYDTRKPRFNYVVTPQTTGSESRQEFIDDDATYNNIEVGLDMMRNLNPDFVGKVITLFFYQELPKVSTRRMLDSAGTPTLLRIADTDTETTEAIARLEFNWLGFADHNIQFNLEGAYNAVDGSLLQTDDTGAGPVVVDVPGANTRVEELRGDFQLNDSWSIGQYRLDYGLGAEISSISQTGDAEQKRSFFFVKPQGTLTYTPGMGQQVRFRLEREIAQLNFNDFISSTVFDDDELALGNPDLRPDSTWVTELGYERRFGRIGVVKLTGFHHWIKDVLDLLPLTDTNAVPGNIGDGRRWGMEFESTIPMEWMGLTGSRLSINIRWQDSSVVDPVTGEKRVLSTQATGTAPAYRSLNTANLNNRYFLRLNYRQDFQEKRFSWGWTVAERNERPLFKVNELDIYDEGYAVDAFIETTRWSGVKIRIFVENILNFDDTRERIVYTGARDLSPVSFTEERSRNSGRWITVSVSGSF